MIGGDIRNHGKEMRLNVDNVVVYEMTLKLDRCSRGNARKQNISCP